MDYSIKSNKTKNWLYRLRHLKISSRNKKTIPDKIVCCRQNEDVIGRNSRARNSFRRSLKKMHSRVRSCVFRQRDSPPLPENNASSSSSSSAAAASKSAPNLVEEPQEEQRRSLPCLYNNNLNLDEPPGAIPTDEITNLSNCYWYWGPLTVSEAEQKLQDAPDGAFLVRDSSSTSYLFSISFRSLGKTLHTRIEHNRGRYSLYDQEGFKTIAELIENALKTSENSVYCYTRVSRLASYPVRFTKPISRYTQVRSLKYLCRFVVRRCTNINDIPKLPCLPNVLYDYLQEGPYF